MERQTDLDALDAIVGKATKGEWWAADNSCYCAICSEQGQIGDMCSSCYIPDIDGDNRELSTANAKCAASLKNAYPALAAELREARREIAELRASNAKLAWAWDTVQDENASRAAEGAKVLQAAVACMNSLAWLEARDRRMKRLGAAEELREITAPYGGDATGCNPQILLDALIKRAAELEAAAGEGVNG